MSPDNTRAWFCIDICLVLHRCVELLLAFLSDCPLFFKRGICDAVSPRTPTLDHYQELWAMRPLLAWFLERTGLGVMVQLISFLSPHPQQQPLYPSVRPRWAACCHWQQLLSHELWCFSELRHRFKYCSCRKSSPKTFLSRILISLTWKHIFCILTGATARRGIALFLLWSSGRAQKQWVFSSSAESYGRKDRGKEKQGA